MAQKHYKSWQDLLSSKGSSEHVNMATGPGAIFGFGNVTINSDRTSLLIHPYEYSPYLSTVEAAGAQYFPKFPTKTLGKSQFEVTTDDNLQIISTQTPRYTHGVNHVDGTMTLFSGSNPIVVPITKADAPDGQNTFGVFPSVITGKQFGSDTNETNMLRRYWPNSRPVSNVNEPWGFGLPVEAYLLVSRRSYQQNSQNQDCSLQAYRLISAPDESNHFMMGLGGLIGILDPRDFNSVSESMDLFDNIIQYCMKPYESSGMGNIATMTSNNITVVGLYLFPNTDALFDQLKTLSTTNPPRTCIPLIPYGYNWDKQLIGTQWEQIPKFLSIVEGRVSNLETGNTEQDNSIIDLYNKTYIIKTDLSNTITRVAVNEQDIEQLENKTDTLESGLNNITPIALQNQADILAIKSELDTLENETLPNFIPSGVKITQINMGQDIFVVADETTKENEVTYYYSSGAVSNAPGNGQYFYKAMKWGDPKDTIIIAYDANNHDEYKTVWAGAGFSSWVRRLNVRYGTFTPALMYRSSPTSLELVDLDQSLTTGSYSIIGNEVTLNMVLATSNGFDVSQSAVTAMYIGNLINNQDQQYKSLQEVRGWYHRASAPVQSDDFEPKIFQLVQDGSSINDSLAGASAITLAGAIPQATGVSSKLTIHITVSYRIS